MQAVVVVVVVVASISVLEVHSTTLTIAVVVADMFQRPLMKFVVVVVEWCQQAHFYCFQDREIESWQTTHE